MNKLKGWASCSQGDWAFQWDTKALTGRLGLSNEAWASRREAGPLTE